MKIKNKGKVYPSPSSSSSSILSFDYVPSDRDFLYVFKLLPAAILALVSALSLEDREVLAYLLTRSVKSANPALIVSESKRKSSKKVTSSGCSNGSSHKPPMFDCDCFDCYRSYWFRWDSSANRELIHQAIEAFEDQLTCGEKSKKPTGRSKRRDRTVRRNLELPSSDESSASPVPSGDSIASSSLFNLGNGELVNSIEKELGKPAEEEVTGETEEEEADVSYIIRASSPSNHKSIARKVLPDVLGLFNSRLWSLWSPHV